MEPWSHESLLDMKRYIQELVLQSSSRHRFPYDQIPARFEHYHRDVRDLLIAKATQWLQAQPGQAGSMLAEYYLEQLQQHFEQEKKADYRQHYARLAQSNVAPTAYLQEALTYKPYLGISDSELPSAASSSAARPACTKLWCNNHGWNLSHKTEQCKRGGAALANTGTSFSVEQLSGLFEQLLVQQAAGGAQQQQPAQQAQAAQQPAVVATAYFADDSAEELYAPGHPALVT
ncbi:hypothetical protein GPECTOR_9g717 [Gonium pectorale]|uniref:Uncharacterized protein n=1 Tax=Gonium pectorale TaxID=33097 RepID=A0A150GS87_GONPE|nr:hypothetical protein GPECTOR_9g717 [Gonium pectorale]|eukprot:KXZ52671.1 hypothetical protein GPECTOR_9g717 [Gonium pectorale]